MSKGDFFRYSMDFLPFFKKLGGLSRPPFFVINMLINYFALISNTSFNKSVEDFAPVDTSTIPVINVL